MRIPLDYYRILGIPLQVSEEQIRQAYQDRLVQLPRREYSETAIASRNELLEEAYGILADAEQRINYVQQWWGQDRVGGIASTQEGITDESADGFAPQIDSLACDTPSIEIDPSQLVGALLIFQELGEYELVIQYGTVALRNTEISPSVSHSRSDLVLSVALAHLELSREQWQQQAYEKAACSGFKGLAWLQEENLYPTIQDEIRNELYHLRPYRILENLATTEEAETNSATHQQGLQLLKEMIGDRQGIEGKGNDRSGLGTDDFLRFIQQLRPHLSVDDQLSLFVEESERPSLAASYLAVYALIAKGFVGKQPSYLIQCQTLLNSLRNRQDVAIEEAICALLLGQTELANKALDNSQDQKALAVIREKSVNSPDLLPGLCVYGENWLKTEVFSHFKDLANQSASLNDYFADPNVQTCLDTLSSDSVLSTPAVSSSLDKGFPMPRNLAEQQDTLSEKYPSRRRRSSSRSRSSRQATVSQAGSATATLPPPNEVAQGTFVPTYDYSRPVTHSYVPSPWSEPSTAELNPQELTAPAPRHRRKRKRKVVINPVRFGLVMAGTLGIMSVGIFGVNSLRSPLNALQADQLNIELNQSPIEIPNTAIATAVSIPQGELTPELAKNLVDSWLSSKAKAFGQEHDVKTLSTILSEPMLSQWRARAMRQKQQGGYRQYDHQIEIKSVQFNANSPDKASIQARVQEQTQYYARKEATQASKQDKDDLLVRYQLIRKNGQWFIQSITAQAFR
ncbi:MAG: IMS domain-containing protein [Snowella sp.]|nr:IMS domain-containing protein [Snowella sp.]